MRHTPREILLRAIQYLGILIPMLMCPLYAVGNPTSFPAEIADSRGITVLIESEPNRIVSLSPSLTETLFAVGAGARVVGVTTYCNYPGETAGIEKIGGFSAKTISVEKVISLEPDLVLADNSRHGIVIEALERYDVPVYSIDSTSIDDCLAVIESVGLLTGNRLKAAEIISDMRLRISTVVGRISEIPDENRVRVFWELFDEPLMTAGPDTFIGQLITLAGGRNIFSDVTESWPKISPEEVLRRDPEVLMSSDSHGEKFTIEQVRSRKGWGELRGVKDGRIHLFDGDMVSRPGPRIVDALEAIAVVLYPERFE